MLLSFSVDMMRPMVEAGLRQAHGEDVGDMRVKRQTIRKLGPRGRALLAWDPLSHTIPYDLQLWWKSRTKDRVLLGNVSSGIRVYQLLIWHSFVEPTDAPNYPVVRISGPRGWRKGDEVLFWSPGDDGLHGFTSEALADGFNSPEEFRDYFVPNMGDRFDAILFKW